MIDPNNILYYSIIFLLLLFFVIYYLYFYNFDNFENTNNHWKTTLKDNWMTIRDECLNVISMVPITSENRNKFWDEIDKSNVKDKWLLGHESIENTWLNYGLIIGYDFIQSNCERCPKTYKILKTLVQNGLKIKVAGFSWLRPNSYIPFHTDPNDETVYHLGLLVPENKAYIHLKINNKDKIIYHKDGDLLTFDDNYSHSAVNNSSEERIILYLLIE